MSDSLCFPLLSGATFLITIARVSGRREHLLPEGHLVKNLSSANGDNKKRRKPEHTEAQT